MFSCGFCHNLALIAFFTCICEGICLNLSSQRFSQGSFSDNLLSAKHAVHREKNPTQIHLALVSWVTKVVRIDMHDQVRLSHTVSTEDPGTSCMLFFLSLVTIAWDWQLVPSFNLWIHMQILSEQVLCFNTYWMAHFSIQGHQACLIG